MFKLICFILIFFNFWLALKALQRCDFKECNYEGECYYNEEREKACKCIGHKYFKGSKCNEIIDNCQTENPCKNNAKCYNLLGQFICQDCKAGFGGLHCDLEIDNVFENMILYFNHYGFYGKTNKFIIMVEHLGEKPFALEFVSNSYAIDSWETDPHQKTKWTFSDNLIKVIENTGIRYYQDIPYTKGFYHLSTQIFWELGQLELHLRSYDTASGVNLFYEQNFQLLIVNEGDKCVPNLNFIHGSNPLDPLKVDIAVYNSFEIIVQNNCFKKSHISYQWSVENIMGTVKLHSFGTTTATILKLPPYKLWFNYHGTVMSSYRLVARMVEQYSDRKIATEARCFILVLPKPIFAIIKGGYFREIGIHQQLILDATSSRDYALSPSVPQDMIFKWRCISLDDPTNKFCRENMQSTSVLKIQGDQLKVECTYNYTLNINSKVNKFVFNEAYQIVKVSEKSQLAIDIQCLRNCERQQFIKDELLHLKAVSQGAKLTLNASYKWFFKDQLIGRNQHLVYKAQDSLAVEGEIKVLVQDVNDKQGSCVLQLKVNLAPTNGNCFIQPLVGEAFKTNFHIKCENYEDIDKPLSYEYYAEQGFPLERGNVKEIFINLPPSSEVAIKICDQFKACAVEKLKVEVKDLSKPSDLKELLTHNKQSLQNLLFKGNILTAMVLLKSLVPILNEIEHVAMIVKETANFNLLTLLQVQQFLDITSNLLKNNLPLNGHKVKVFNKLLLKLYSGLNAAIQDNEIQSFSRKDYEKSTKDLMVVMNSLSQIWEIIPPPMQDETSAVIVSSNEPLKETYEVLADFDIDIVFQLAHWLTFSNLLENIYQDLSLAAPVVYRPLEYTFELKEDSFVLKICALNTDTRQEIQLHANTVTISLSADLLKELQQNLNAKEISIHMAALKNNPFWWYPSKTPLNTAILKFACMGGRKPFNFIKNLNNPFEFKFEINKITPKTEYLEGIIKNNTQMSLYSLLVEANALLVVNFLKTEKPLKILVKFDQMLYGFEVLKTGLEVNMSLEKQTFIFNNPLNHKTTAYLGILLSQSGQNVVYAFSTELHECLYWDFSLTDPQWFTEGCIPQLKVSANQSLTCFCHHFSTFAGKSYTVYMQEDLKEHSLLLQLPFNWSLLIFYLSLGLILFLILISNLICYKNQKEFLALNITAYAQHTMEVHIYTGSHFNATTTANITLKMISQNGPFTLTITQDPLKPVLKRNSVCKIKLSNKDIDIPLELLLKNDGNGCYPAWYCHKILVINWEHPKQQQTFFINSCLNRQTLEILSSDFPKITFWSYFSETLSVIYLNWFQFEAMWGCWQYKDLNRLERCCILLSQLMVTVCFLSCYFGPTTLETYEQERILYCNLSFNIWEFMLLSVVCYALSFFIKLLFLSSLCLMDKVILNKSSTSEKLL